MIVSTVLLAGLFVAPVALPSLASPVHAVNVFDSNNDKFKGLSESKANGERDINKLIAQVLNVLFFLIGAISAIAIIIGGIRYATSNGDASSIKSAKDTIMYAVIGLVVAIMAGGIVNFVISRF